MKKGQVTILIIVAILFVIIIGIYFIITFKNSNETKVPLKFEVVYNFVDECVKESAED